MARKRKKKNLLDADFLSSISMSTPWGESPNSGTSVSRLSRGNTCVQKGKYLSKTELKKFVEERSAVHVEYIRQTHMTKRRAMMIGCLCIVASCALLVFAPEHRETTSYAVSLALVIVAGGAFGYGQISLKSKEHELRVDAD